MMQAELNVTICCAPEQLEDVTEMIKLIPDFHEATISRLKTRVYSDKVGEVCK